MKVDKASYSPIFIALDTAIGAILSCSCCFSIGRRHWWIANFVSYDTVRLWWHFMVSYDSYSTIRMSLPKIIRVTAVFLLVLCLFAMIFMELFGLTKYGLETHEHSNFRDYGNALLLLIRVATGEAWVMNLSRDLLSCCILIVFLVLEYCYDGFDSASSQLCCIRWLLVDRLWIASMGLLSVQYVLSRVHTYLSQLVYCCKSNAVSWYI